MRRRRVGTEGGHAQTALRRRRNAIERGDRRRARVGARLHLGAREQLPAIVDGDGDGKSVPELQAYHVANYSSRSRPQSL